jgi:hypothetical protein
MTIKKLCRAGLLSLFILGSQSLLAQDNPLGQTFQINTHLSCIVGKPSWLIIVRDEETGQVLPFLYDINTEDNFWLGFTFSHAYRVITSELDFGPPNAKIHNFCHLQDGILDHESFTATLSGPLTPNRYTSTCHVTRYKQYSFPIVNQDTGTSAAPTDAAGIEAAETTAANPAAAPAGGSAVGNAVSQATGGALSAEQATAIANAITSSGATNGAANAAGALGALQNAASNSNITGALSNVLSGATGAAK